MEENKDLAVKYLLDQSNTPFTKEQIVEEIKNSINTEFIFSLRQEIINEIKSFYFENALTTPVKYLIDERGFGVTKEEIAEEIKNSVEIPFYDGTSLFTKEDIVNEVKNSLSENFNYISSLKEEIVNEIKAFYFENASETPTKYLLDEYGSALTKEQIANEIKEIYTQQQLTIENLKIELTEKQKELEDQKNEIDLLIINDQTNLNAIKNLNKAIKDFNPFSK